MMNSQPDRAKENSPPIHRWVSGRTQSESRQGRKNTIASADVLFHPHAAWEFSLIVNPAINRWAIFKCPSGTRSCRQVADWYRQVAWADHRRRSQFTHPLI